MINKEPFSNLCARMNFNSGFAHSPLGNPSRQKIMLFQVQPMGNPVMQHHLEAGVKKYLHSGMNSRIALSDHCNFFLYSFNQSHLNYSFIPNSGAFFACRYRILEISL